MNAKLISIGVAVLIATCTSTVTGQDRSSAGDSNSFAALTAEIHQLRLAVEESTRTQTQTQALSVYLSAQQSRLVQVSTRLDAARKELDGVVAGSRELTTAVVR